MAGSEGGANRPYRIEGRECHTLAELAEALAANWDSGIEHLTGGYVGKWIEESLGDIDAKIALDRLLKVEQPHDQLLFTFITRYWQGGAPPFKGVPLSWEQLERIAKDDLPEGLDKGGFLFDLYASRALTLAAAVTGDERLAEADRQWQKELLDYCTARAEYLSCEEIWNDRGGALEMCLASPQAEAFFIQYFHNGQRNEDAARSISGRAKSDIFDAQFDPEFAGRLRLDREDELFAQLRNRAWFARMDRPEESSLGRDMAMQSASMIAAAEHGALRRQMEASAEQEETAGKDWPLAMLDQKGHAILYGGAMALAALLGIWDLSGWYLSENFQNGTYLALAIMIFYAVTLYGATAARRSTGVMLAIAGGIALFGSIAIAFVASYSTLFNMLIFGGAFAALGWLREPFIAFKRKDRIAADKAAIEARMAGSPNREEDPEVVLGYLDFWSRGIPRDQILRHSRQQAMAGGSAYSPSASPETLARQTAKAGPAAYQANGTSYEIMGMNVGADGAVTHELVDGISFDDKGRVNTRVVDGVTLHNDGKVTTNVTKGVDIRSDGQVSVEMFGFRHSWGGKKDEKKKDSWF